MCFLVVMNMSVDREVELGDAVQAKKWCRWILCRQKCRVGGNCIDREVGLGNIRQRCTMIT